MPKGIIFRRDLVQGTDEWMAARCGLLTASELHLIVTPTLKVANNDSPFPLCVVGPWRLNICRRFVLPNRPAYPVAGTMNVEHRPEGIR